MESAPGNTDEDQGCFARGGRRAIGTLLAAACALLLAATSTQAQTINDTGLWLSTFAQGDFNHDKETPAPLLWWFDGQARFLDDASYFNQGVIRPGLGTSITKNAQIWAGYAWFRTQPVGGGSFDESRFWQQLTWSTKRDLFTVATRTRFEQRFVDTGSDTGWRIRQFQRVQRDLPHFPRLKLVCWDEVFFNLNDTNWGAASGFDQNRVFAGFGWKRDPDSRFQIEVGYLNQFIHRPGRDDLSNHILSVNLFRSR